MVGELPAFLREHAHRHDGLSHDAVRPRGSGALLGPHGERVCVVLRDLRKAVVQVLGGRAHRHRGGVDQALGDEAWIEVDVLAHRMVTHVLDAAGENDVASAVRDLTGAGGDCCQGSGAHAVDREAGNGLWDTGEQRDVASEGQSLVADLGGGRVDDVADPLRRNLRVAAQQLAHDLDGHVVGTRLPEDALRSGPAEGRAHAVDEHDLPTFHQPSLRRGFELLAQVLELPAVRGERIAVDTGSGACRRSRACRRGRRSAGGGTDRARRPERRPPRAARCRSAGPGPARVGTAGSRRRGRRAPSAGRADLPRPRERDPRRRGAWRSRGRARLRPRSYRSPTPPRSGG